MVFKASGISVRTAERLILRDIDFEIAHGEILGICGSSLQSTEALWRVLSCIDQADSGRVWLDGSELLETGDLKSRVATVEGRPQRSTAGWLERIFGKGTRPVGFPRDLISEIGGAKRPVAVVVEPFTHSNLSERDGWVEKLKSLVKEKHIIMIIANTSFDDLMLACDKILVLDGADVGQIGTPSEVYCDPSSVAVARATGRCNVFAARRLSSSKSEVPEFQSILGSHRFTTERVEKHRLGALNQNVSLAIRPEHISISFGASFPEDNVIRAVVERVSFLGPTTLVDCNANGLPLTVNVMRLVGLSVGDECLLGLPPERIRIFAA